MTAEEKFAELLAKYPRVAIAGGPRTGKTTLSGLTADRKVIGTDAYQEMGWSEIPGAMIRDTRDLDSFVVEGVMVARALRKGLKVDAVVWLETPKTTQSPGQTVMSKGVKTVFNDWLRKAPGTPVFRLDGDAPEQKTETVEEAAKTSAPRYGSRALIV